MTDEELLEEFIEIIVFLATGLKMPLSNLMPCDISKKNSRIISGHKLKGKIEREILRRMKNENCSIKEREGVKVCGDA